ncbi:hypothetical protein Dimus_032262 [Dionaea muscipula]
MQMGSNFKKVIFDEHVQAGLRGWAQKARQRKGGLKTASTVSGNSDGSTAGIQLVPRARKETSNDEIQPTAT